MTLRCLPAERRRFHGCPRAETRGQQTRALRTLDEFSEHFWRSRNVHRDVLERRCRSREPLGHLAPVHERTPPEIFQEIGHLFDNVWCQHRLHDCQIQRCSHQFVVIKRHVQPTQSALRLGAVPRHQILIDDVPHLHLDARRAVPLGSTPRLTHASFSTHLLQLPLCLLSRVSALAVSVPRARRLQIRHRHHLIRHRARQKHHALIDGVWKI